jgi:hypothetical protein
MIISDTPVVKKRKYKREGTFGLVTGFGMLALMLLAGFIFPNVSKYDPNQPGLPPLLAPNMIISLARMFWDGIFLPEFLMQFLLI